MDNLMGINFTAHLRSFFWSYLSLIKTSIYKNKKHSTSSAVQQLALEILGHLDEERMKQSIIYYHDMTLI